MAAKLAHRLPLISLCQHASCNCIAVTASSCWQPALVMRRSPPAPSRGAQLATIACTLPEEPLAMRKGDRIWFAHGRIGGVLARRGNQRVEVEVEITHARESGEKSAADKGINLPDTQLDLPALTDKNTRDLAVAAQLVVMIAVSFSSSADDMRALHARLERLGEPDLELVLKNETRRGFELLLEMLMAAMACPNAGVMIARGDLAAKLCNERMAKLQ